MTSKNQAIELLGSTETGAVAHREITASEKPELWQTFNDVRLLHTTPTSSGQTDLVVGSPRIGRPDGAETPPPEWATGDIIELVGTAGFRAIGRHTDMLKINGQRLHLETVRKRLGEVFPTSNLSVTRIDHDPSTGEGYAVIAHQPSPDKGQIRAALRGFPSPLRVEHRPAANLGPNAVPGEVEG